MIGKQKKISSEMIPQNYVSLNTNNRLLVWYTQPLWEEINEYQTTG